MPTLPGAVALDGGGNLFIVDSTNCCVWRVDAATGNVTIVAGMVSALEAGFMGDGGPATQATLKFPSGVAVDRRGNVFIADRHNHLVRRVDAGSGIITTVGGLEQPTAAADIADRGGGGRGAGAAAGAGAA